MIKNSRKLDNFYRQLAAKENLSYKEALRIYDALHKEAVVLGAISHENIWEGFEVDLRITKAMGRLKRARKTDKKNSRKVRRR
ncbi:MAG: hypothetical protein MUP16_10270 [Sedimentisphaerales bacterium]|jgi:hypothetical protein|nr:hypothetical protein [Sedimentisphaerales bacterium]